MFRFSFASGQFNGRFGRDDDDHAMLCFLRCLIALNVRYLQKNPGAPSIYEWNGYYRRRIRKGQMDDDWQDISTCLTLGYGDCEDFACWRIAELVVREGMRLDIDRQLSEIDISGPVGPNSVGPALSRVDYQDGGWLYHVKLASDRYGVEDPSENLDRFGLFRLGKVG